MAWVAAGCDVEFVRGVPAGRRDAILAGFAADTLLNDVRREFAGTASIRAWARRELVDDKVAMAVGGGGNTDRLRR
ncbi:hypothetical protein ABIA39_003351 [Nocardia sp. GAS34]|uniref:hypothetical protein n=1 Tax=unclassified Nocardia TaxID=2637762 RepID=UPI003D1A2BAE